MSNKRNSQYQKKVAKIKKTMANRGTPSGYTKPSKIELYEMLAEAWKNTVPTKRKLTPEQRQRKNYMDRRRRARLRDHNEMEFKTPENEDGGITTNK